MFLIISLLFNYSSSNLKFCLQMKLLTNNYIRTTLRDCMSLVIAVRIPACTAGG